MSKEVLILRMITSEDLKRLMGNKLETENRINKVMETCKNSTTDWAKNYWFSVWQKLCIKYDRMDLYRANLH